jgi:hypothetical protein
MMTPLQANLGVIRNLQPENDEAGLQLMSMLVGHQRGPMVAMLSLNQAMLLRKSGAAPAMVLPTMVLPTMALPTMALPTMALKIAQICLRQSLPRRFKVTKIAINHPNKYILAGFATPEMALKTCDPHA